MKKCILLLLAVCLLLSGCSTTLMGNTGEIPYETFGSLDLVGTPSLNHAYFCAYSLQRQDAYEEAYAIFQLLSDQHPFAAAEAARFVWLEDTLVRTDTYINGELISSEKALYDSMGKLAKKDVCVLEEQTYSDNKEDPYVVSEKWLYDIHVVHTTTEAPYYLEFIYDPNGIVLTQTREPSISVYFDGLAITGYTVNYTYDSDGRIVAETGADRLHYIPDGGVLSVSELPFEGSYTYDASGRLLRYERSYTGIEGGISWDSYTYDADGNLLLHESRKEGDVFFDPTIRYESTVREYRYDKDGNKLFESTLTLRGENSESTQRDYTQTEYLYENGQLMKQTQTFEGDETVNETVYTYEDYLVYIDNPKEVTGDDSDTAETGEPK